MKILLLLRHGWWVAFLAACLAVAVLRWMNSHAQPPTPLGLREGKLAPCPDSPNCVSSQAGTKAQQVEPFPAPQGLDSLRRLQTLVAATPRTRVVEESEGYFRAEAKSFLLGFIDDVEFALSKDGRSIEVRSASRVGHSDLGVNRARVERLRERYAEANR